MAEVISHAPSGCPALVLNADFRPLSYYPLSLWPWQEVIKAVFLERVDVVAEYDQFVHSPSLTMRIPSVIALREFVRQDRPRRSLGSTYSCATGSSAPIVVRARISHSTTLSRARRADAQAGKTSSPPAARATCARADGCRARCGCTRMSVRTGHPPTSCRRSAAAFRPTTSTPLGSTISIGMSNWTGEEVGRCGAQSAPHPPFVRLVSNVDC